MNGGLVDRANGGLDDIDFLTELYLELDCDCCCCSFGDWMSNDLIGCCRFSCSCNGLSAEISLELNNEYYHFFGAEYQYFNDLYLMKIFFTAVI